MCKTGLLTFFGGEEKDAFSTRLLEALNGGALAVMVSIGHRTGLFDLMAELPPSSSIGIAQAAQLNERYVREWLSAMVVGQIVEYDHVEGRYWLPPQRAAVLTRHAPADNLALFAQYVPLMGAVEEKIMSCFINGGGVPYNEYNRFHEVMAEDSGQLVLQVLHDAIIPLAPDLSTRLSAGSSVLDIGCGVGEALMLLAKSFPASRFVGYDISEEALARARTEARSRKLENVNFVLQDAAKMIEHGQYDAIFSFDAIHDQAHPQQVLDNIYRALRSHGVYIMQEIGLHTNVTENIGHPVAPLLYAISCMHCMPVSLAAGGEGLGAAWGVERAEEMIRKAGFKHLEIKQLPHDIQNAYFVMHKD